jgi:hypothetical protein
MSLDELRTLVGTENIPTRPDPETGEWGLGFNGIGIRLTRETIDPAYVASLHAGEGTDPSL